MFDAVCDEVRSRFAGARGSHDWEHTQRVLVLAERLARAEGADLGVVRLAAVLHDVGRADEDRAAGGLDHAARGADLAREILARHGAPPERIAAVVHCIAAHRFRKGPAPETLEARVLFDADKLDAIGAVGIARAYLFAGEVGAMLHNPDIPPEDALPYSLNDTGHREYRVKLSRIRERMLTGEGRRMAEERHAFMEAFFERFLLEHEGEK